MNSDFDPPPKGLSILATVGGVVTAVVAIAGLKNIAVCNGTITGTWTGTLQFVTSIDGGTTLNPVTVTSAASTTVLGSSQTTANTSFVAYVADSPYFAVVATAAMTGTAFVAYSCGLAPGPL